MNPKFGPLSRRTFLRGAGAALALPLLDAMLPTSRAAAVAARPPVRMAFLYFPNGVWQDAWIPKNAGYGYDLPFSLEPLATVRKSVTVVSRLDKANSRTGDGHYAKTANFLTGLHVTRTAGRDVNAGGVSIDQLAAAQIGRRTPLPSLELATDPVANGVDRNVNYTRLYASYISWRSASVPMAREINPRSVFDRMFRARAGGSHTGSADTRSLLDLTMDDARDLRRQLGQDDQRRLDEYLDAVNSVEHRLTANEQLAAADVSRWTPPTSPANLTPPPANIPRANFREQVKLMLDMIVLAYWTDTTRISTFMFANDVSGRNFSFIEGVRASHHDTSHHANDRVKIEQYQRIVKWHVEQYVYLLTRLSQVREGERTLLDNSMIMFGSSFSDGNRHDPNNLPILVGGQAGGRIRTGQHIASPRGTPLCNLYVSMLDCMGCPVQRFGDSTGPLQGLTV